METKGIHFVMFSLHQYVFMKTASMFEFQSNYEEEKIFSQHKNHHKMLKSLVCHVIKKEKVVFLP